MWGQLTFIERLVKKIEKNQLLAELRSTIAARTKTQINYCIPISNVNVEKHEKERLKNSYFGGELLQSDNVVPRMSNYFYHRGTDI